jgi:hypothetical protein
MTCPRLASLTLWFCFAALLAWWPTAHAGVADAPGADLEVSLVTYGPGAIYWERFGHDAIELRDRASGEAVNFNYGVFDFEQKNFLLNFARGYMRYSIDAEAAGPEIGWYIGAGRWVQRQRLALTAPQAAALRDFLLWNLRPRNAQYDYDYFADNCTTRVRDALDRALGGALHAQLQAPSPITYRQQTDRLMAAQPWLMLVLDLGLGPYADQPLSRWRAGFIPMTLMQQLRGVRVADGHGGTRPLVIDDTRVADARLAPPPAAPPDLRWPLLVAGLVLAALLGWSGRTRLPRGNTPARTQRVARIVFAATGTAWLVFAGLAGILLAVLWAFTAHRSAWANENLLLFNPLALLLLPAVWRAHVPRFTRGLVVLMAAAALFALLAKILPGFDQRNLPWIAFALPPWLALLYALLFRRALPAVV